MLWEIGDQRRRLKAIRARLISTPDILALLRGPQDEDLVRVGTGPADHRVRAVRLTGAGRAERAELDRRSDEFAWSLLAPLNDRQRARLTDAMGRSSSFSRRPGPDQSRGSGQPAARFCLQSYFAELDSRFDTGFDPAATIPAGTPTSPSRPFCCWPNSAASPADAGR